MKKSILLTLFCCVAFLHGFSQNEEYRHVGSASIGLSLTGSLLNLLDDATETGTIEVKNTPALQLTYDYGIKKFFSIGVAVGFQNFNIDAEDFTYTNSEGIEKMESFTADYSRLNVAIRPLFHYANNEKLDLYSGFRIGMLNNNIDAESTIDNSTIDDFDLDGFNSLTRLSFGITAFGLRYYFTDNIGAGFEINLGAPYITAFNINARF